MVRPIDVQDNLAKTQAAERLAQIQKAHGEVGQKQIAEAFKKQAADAMKKAHEAGKADMVIISNEEHEEKEKKKKKKKKKKKHGQAGLRIQDEYQAQTEQKTQDEKNEQPKQIESESPNHLDLTG